MLDACENDVELSTVISKKDNFIILGEKKFEESNFDNVARDIVYKFLFTNFNDRLLRLDYIGFNLELFSDWGDYYILHIKGVAHIKNKYINLPFYSD